MEAGQRDGGHAVFTGVELWCGRNCAGQPGNEHRENERVSSGAVCGGKSAWDEARRADEWFQDESGWADVTSVRCNGKWIPIGITVDATNGRVLSIDQLPGEDAEQLKAWLEPILNAVDADGYWPSQWWIIRYPLWAPKRGEN